MPVVVRLRSAVCLLGRFPALAGVDLDVEAGEVVLLSGANGSGKTTLLRLLAGLHRLQSGTGVVLGHDLSIDRRGARRAIGLLGHDTGCYDDLTVRENLRFAVRAAGGDASAVRHRARARRADGAGRRRARSPVGGATTPARARRRARARPAAPAPRRAPRRPRRGRPRRARRRGRRRPRRGPHRHPRLARARPDPRPGRPRGRPRRRRRPLRRRGAGRGPTERRRRQKKRCGRDEPLAGDGARGGQGPAHRGPLARDAVPGPAVRAHRRPLVRVRARSQSRRAVPRRPRIVLGGRAAGRAAGGVALLPGRDRERRPRRAPPLRPRPGGGVPREGGGHRDPAGGARGRRSAPASPSCTTSSCARSGCSWRRRWPRLPAWPPPVPSTAFWLQVCGCARRSSRCCCCRWWRR